MKLYYGSTPIFEGGAKLIFGADTVEKLYFGSELVYQNMLPVGTVLWEGDLVLTDMQSHSIDLPAVREDWGNVNNSVMITWRVGNNSNEITTTTKDTLVNSAPLYSKQFNNTYAHAIRRGNTFNVGLTFGTTVHVTKIELV